MPILIQSQKPDATVTAAVADGVGLLLLIGDAVDKPQFSRSFEYLFCLPSRDLPAHAVFHYIMSQLIEMQTNFRRILAIR